MRICSHTMATPDLDLAGAIDLSARLAFDGIEIICADDYGCAIGTNPAASEIDEVRTRTQDRGLTIAGLVPYARAFNALDDPARGDAIGAMERAIDIAKALGAAGVRVFGGETPSDDSDLQQRQFNLLVDALSHLAAYAGDGLPLNVENHPGTAAVTGAVTRAIVDAVDAPNVGIIFDPGNLMRLGGTDMRSELAVQREAIRHVHFKDVVIGGERHLDPAQAGRGQVPWQDLIADLTRTGYRGFISTEFERRWHPDLLPEAEAGLRHEKQFIKNAIAASRL